MKLSKEQIESLENRLQKNGLTYWDIRIEILDHLASEIETKMSKGESYESAVENSFQKLNLLGDLSGLNRSKLMAINKIVKKQFYKEVQKIFTQFKNLLILVLFVTCYSFIYLKSNTTIFKYVTLFFIATPILIGTYFHLREFALKKKSGYLIYTSFYVFFVYLLLNVFFQFCQPDGLIPVSRDTQWFIWFIITIINTVFSFAGLNLHFKTLRRIKNIQKSLA